MAQVTLDTPLTLDPQQAVTLRLVNATLDFTQGRIVISVEFVDGDGQVLQFRQVEADGGAVATYVANQANTILTRLLAKLDVTGAIS